MRIFKRIIFILGILSLIVIILFSVTLYTVKHIKIKKLVEKEIEETLGIKISIGKITFSPFLAHIGLEKVTIHNPPGFVDDELAYLEYLHFVFDPIEMLTRKKPNIYLMALDLKRLNVIKNKKGMINIKEIIPVQEAAATGNDETPFYFDVVVISVDKVKYTDYSGPVKKEHKYNVGIKEVALLRLKDENAAVKMIIYKALQDTDIGKLINLTIVPVFSAISDTVDSAWSTAKIGSKGVWQISTLPIKILFGKN